MGELKLQAPIELEMKVSITNDEGLSGVATVGLGIGKFPDADDIRNALERFEAGGLPPGFRLMNKREWWDSVVGVVTDTDDDGEPVSVPVAMPGGPNWDD